jgi:hypothetical protein
LVKFSKVPVLLLLVAMVLITIILRYPLVEHERQQTDSYFIHALSGSIVDHSYAKWTFNPLSYFGYYPISYPSGAPFLLSEASMLTGLSIESCILLTNMVLGILFCLAVFALARFFIRRPEFVLVAVLCTVMAARFVDTTYWNASARGLGVVLITLLILVLFQSSRTFDPRFYTMAILIGVGCFVSHHMAVLVVIFAIGYALAAFQVHYLLKMTSRRKKTATLLAFNIAVLASIMMISFVYFDFFGKLLLSNLQKTSLFDLNPPILSAVLNTASAYTNQIGFILPVAVLGFLFVYKKRAIDTGSLFLVTSLIAFVPLLGNHLYVSMLLTPIVAIIGGLVIAHIYGLPSRRIYRQVFVIVLLASSMVLPYWSIQRWNSNEYMSGDIVETEEVLFSDSIYLRYVDVDTRAICNVGIIESQLYANSGMSFLASGIMLAVNDELTSTDIDENVVWSESSFPMNLYKWFQYQDEPLVEYYIKGLMINGLEYISDPAHTNEAREYFLEHPKLTVVVDNNWPSQYVDSFSIRNADFLGELAKGLSTEDTGVVYSDNSVGSYLTYKSERISVYIVDLFD